VQLFFVVSAWTLWRSAHLRQERGWHFYALRRFFRIAPLYYLFIVIYGLLAFLGWREWEFYRFAPVLANVLCVHGLIPDGNHTIVPGGWSIGTEMAFYVLFPFLFCWARSRRRILGLLVCWVFLLLGLNLWFLQSQARPLIDENYSFFYRHVVVQLPAFLCGILAWELRDARNSFRILYIAGGFLLGLVGTVLFRYFNNSLLFLIPVCFGWAFSGILMLLERHGSGLDNGSLRWLQAVGRKSYGIYLVHFIFVLWVWAEVEASGILRGWPFFANLFVGIVVVLFLSYGVACGLARWVEQPAIELGQYLIRRWPQRRKL
jgi:peptidoglycan/LPS O-acetylase OafA/YrhL